MSNTTPEFGARAGSAFLDALVKAALHKSDEHLAAEVRQAGGKSSDTKVSLQRSGERRMWFDEVLVIAAATDRSFFLRWVAQRLGLPAAAGSEASLGESIRGCRRAMGRVLGRMEDAASPDSDEGGGTSRTEALALLREVRELKAEAARMEAELEARVRPEVA